MSDRTKQRIDPGLAGEARSSSSHAAMVGSSGAPKKASDSIFNAPVEIPSYFTAYKN